MIFRRKKDERAEGKLSEKKLEKVLNRLEKEQKVPALFDFTAAVRRAAVMCWNI